MTIARELRPFLKLLVHAHYSVYARREMAQSSNRVAYAALVLALVALGLHLFSGRQEASGPRPDPASSPNSLAPDTTSLLSDLARRVHALEAHRAPEVNASTTTETAKLNPSEHPEPKHFVSFDLASSALRIQQAENGALSVTNSDAALTGKMMRIKAKAEDGSEEEITILVPPPPAL